ncbi:hypothetical protein PHJA_001430500 [Phtheirospermum japonicum]|uniref:Uncharacterized protein n=1 Tax=Phtheirospermum japonicum TaxID=374723 RepID=A0A830C3Y5_9LAMI|nr:hypothetical protein PHJA_001430500 [Phtheirospermum japonicum]
MKRWPNSLFNTVGPSSGVLVLCRQTALSRGNAWTRPLLLRSAGASSSDTATTSISQTTQPRQRSAATWLAGSLTSCHPAIFSAATRQQRSLAVFFIGSFMNRRSSEEQRWH